MTTLNIIPTRCVRRTDSGTIAITQWLGAMAQTFEELMTAPWREAQGDILDTSLPVNMPDKFLQADDRYDAFRQSGNAENSRQVVYAGMACHTIKIPASAASTFVRGVSFRCNADKFAVGGLKVAAVLSDIATPPTGWDLCRMGGTDSAIDVSKEFATAETEHPDWGTIGILAETSKVREGSVNRTGIFALDLSAETGAWKYLHLVISMFMPSASRYEYFVEGSGMIDPQSVAVTFNANGITPDAPPTEPPVQLVQKKMSEGVTIFSANNAIYQYATGIYATSQPNIEAGLVSLYSARGSIPVSQHHNVGIFFDTNYYMAFKVVCAACTVNIGKKITQIKLPYEIKASGRIRFRLSVYVNNEPNVFMGQNPPLGIDTVKDVSLWTGQRKNLGEYPIKCVFNKVIESPISSGDPINVDEFVTENPALALLFAFSVDRVIDSTPGAVTPNDTLTINAADIINGYIVQEQ